MLKKIAVAAVIFFTGEATLAQVKTNVSVLAESAKTLNEENSKNYQKALALASQKGWQLSFTTGSGNLATLVGVDFLNRPIYYVTQSNVIAAATTGANQLWNGGISGLNLSGSSNSVKSKLGVWDGGRVLLTHVEMNGRVSQRDNATTVSDHATHVSGTMIASGVNAVAKGMAYGMQELYAYDFGNDASEMFLEASNLLLSNHSYGTLSGWNFNGSANRWEFYGQPSANEDQNFGYYNSQAQLFDSIAYNAPFYLIVKSAGNNRSENGPAVGATYYRFDGSGNMVNAGPRPAGISNNDSYDIISTTGTAKNILTVGAVNGIANGYTNVNDVVMSSFSSWGPTDDGRIKPDVVADGVNLQSSVGSSTTAYGVMSGTSMSSPNATGSLLLLQEYYAQLHAGNFMRAATLKGLAIHCADESGAAPGPDYKHGWGLLNVAKAANVIKSNNLQSHQIFENVLNNSATFTMNVVASGPLTATIVWTDPKGNVITSNILDNTSPRLIHDLDIRIIQGSTTYMPWKLDPANPDNPATTGDNILDNVEKIFIANAAPGLTYTIQITHKGTLARGLQAYSLILSGVNGQVFCASAPTSSAGARIDSVGFGSIQKLNTGNCTTYSDFTSISTVVEPSQVLPITVRVNSCDATTANKVVKAYIDFNNDGDFTDAGENVATSPVISGNFIFTGSVTISPDVIVGNPSALRVIVQETSNQADVTPCGSYAKGETQDYKIIFGNPSRDLKIEDLTSLSSTGSCANTEQVVAVKIKNTGAATQANIPVTAVIKNGATTVATLTGTYIGTLAVNESVVYTLPSNFNAVAGTTYTASIYINDPTDQVRNNDTLNKSIAIAAAVAAPSGSGRICGTGAILLADNASTPNYFWYADVNGNPLGVGIGLNTTTVPTNNTYYIGTGARATAGVAANSTFPNGGGYLSGATAYMKYTAAVPMQLETVKLYTKFPGKVDIIVGDITSESGGTFQYSTLSTTTVDVYASSPTVASGTQNVYDAADQGGVYYVNIFLPSGSHAIIIKTQGSTNLFRHNNVTGSPYPLGIPNFITFTSNSAATEGGTSQGYYYFLYNMKLRTADCLSNRGTVVATVAPTPTISQAGNVLTSSSTTGNQWSLNGTVISGANNATYNATQSGNYTVTVTDAFGCQRTSNVFNVTFTAVDPVTVSSADVMISPNPTKGLVNIRYKAVRNDELKIQIVNTQGQTIVSKNYGKFVGDFSEQINLRKAAGVYMLKLQHGNKVFYKKLIIE